MYHDAGFVENWAQGIRKVFRECERNGNPKPEFSLESGGLRVTVTSNVIDVDERIPISVVSTKTRSPTDRQKVIVRMWLRTQESRYHPSHRNSVSPPGP